MGAATGSATPGSRDALGDCTARCRRPPRPRRTARQQAPTKMSEASYGTPTSGAQTLAAGSLRDFRVPFVPDTLSALDTVSALWHLIRPATPPKSVTVRVFLVARGSCLRLKYVSKDHCR